MIADLKPYANYVESGIPWLGKIPSHWKVKRAKSIFQRVDIRSKTGQEELLTVSSARGIVPRKSASVTMFKAESYLGYKLCWPGDLVINSLWAWAGGLGVSKHHGIISSAYGIYRVREDAPMLPAFIHEVARSSSFNWELKVRSKGVWISRLQLTDISFLDAPMHIPPIAEQDAVVRFLEWANGRLDRAIRAKRKVIALLNEQKQAIIHRAVTRGLDPSVPLKPSGIPWVGDIPQNYKRTKLGRLCISVRDGTHNPPPALPGIHRLLSVRNIVNGQFVVRNDDRTMLPSAFAELQRSYTVERGDVVVAIVGATTGKSAVVGDMQNVTVQRSLAILRPNPKIIAGEYLGLLITSQVIQRQIKQIMDKYAAQPGIYLNELSGLQVLYPSLKDQTSIITFVQASTEPLISAINRIEREIDLLREYRTRLVADVVTGKLDVREAAAKLPVEEQAIEPEELVEDNSEMIEDEITEPAG